MADSTSDFLSENGRSNKMVQRERHVCEDMRIEMKHHTINPATKLVIPRKRHREIQKRPGDYWKILRGYTWQKCNQNAWAKPSTNFICCECEVALEAEETD